MHSARKALSADNSKSFRRGWRLDKAASRGVLGGIGKYWCGQVLGSKKDAELGDEGHWVKWEGDVGAEGIT